MVRTTFSVPLSSLLFDSLHMWLCWSKSPSVGESVLFRCPCNEDVLERTPQSLLLYHIVCIVIYICSTVPLDFDFFVIKA